MYVSFLCPVQVNSAPDDLVHSIDHVSESMASSPGSRNIITLSETDEVDHPTATYIYSESPVNLQASKKDTRDQDTGRVDVIVSRCSMSSIQ